MEHELIEEEENTMFQNEVGLTNILIWEYVYCKTYKTQK
jgi:hypothetical protein